jgi:hypothetical protein
MIKFIVFCTKILVVAIVALLFTSCKHMMDGIEGNGNITKEKRIISESFTKVEVSHGIKLIVEQGESVMVEVETDQNLQKQLITKVENGTLIVKFEGSINNTNAETVRIRMPKIEGISADSGAEVTSKNTLLGNTTIKLEADSGSNIDVVLEYDAIELNADSGAEIKAEGKALKLKTHADSGANIDASNLLANEVTSHADSAASTSLHPIVSLNADADSGASIEYNSKPKTIIKKEDSGGSVSSSL